MSGTGVGTVPAPTRTSTARLPSATVVICAYTDRRWDQIAAAVQSVQKQTHPASQCVLVIDHNDSLLERARETFPDVEVVPNSEERGLSGARNSGVRHAKAEVVVFLDDDARGDDKWLEHLLDPYADPTVIGTGGSALPVWPRDRPGWFPREFDWVVGCSYTGLPDRSATVRNPIGANMSFRREAFPLAGGFDSGVGRLGTLPLGCEETVFSIRVLRLTPKATVVYVPDAVVFHYISDDRTTVGYFVRRCVAEGLSKATVTAHVGKNQGLKSERRYVTRVLPRGFVLGLLPRRGYSASPAASAMIVVGLLATILGYVLGRVGWIAVAGRLIGRKAS